MNATSSVVYASRFNGLAACRRGELLSAKEREEIRSLCREVKGLRRANEILKSASVFFAKELDPERTK